MSSAHSEEHSDKNPVLSEKPKIAEKSISTNSKRSSNLNPITNSSLSETSAFKRFNDLHEKIENFTLDFLKKLFECRDTRVMIRSRNESKKLAINFSQQNLDYK